MVKVRIFHVLLSLGAVNICKQHTYSIAWKTSDHFDRTNDRRLSGYQRGLYEDTHEVISQLEV
jgi:hypothetical protein